MLAAFEHPNILRLYAAGESLEGPWLLTELLTGYSLERLPRGEDPVGPILEVASALEELHTRGIIHRDVKPANIFQTEEGRTVLLDLGLARPVDQSSLTASGFLVGSPAFVAPECLGGAEIATASDWFALGVSLYCLLEGGRVPFLVPEMQEAASGEKLPAVRFRKMVSRWPVARLVRALLAQDPQNRPSSRKEMEDLLRQEAPPSSLRSFGESPPPSKKVWATSPTWMLGGALLGLLLGGLYSFSNQAPPSVSLPTREISPQAVGVRKTLWVPPLPSRELLQRAEQLAVFELLPAERRLGDEGFLVRVLPALEDPVISQRWRGYLRALAGWLDVVLEGAKSPEEVDHRLLSPVLLPHYRRLFLTLPEGFLGASNEAVARALDFSFGGQTKELRAAMEGVFANRKHFLQVAREASNQVEDWFLGRSSWIFQSSSMQLVQVTWIRVPASGQGKDGMSVLFDRLLPLAPTSPVGDHILRRSYLQLSNIWFRRSTPCQDQVHIFKKVLQVASARQIPPSEEAILRTSLGRTMFNLETSCPEDLVQQGKHALAQFSASASSLSR
jgi:hypothetical protein